jgi:hypothetical protein
MERSYSERAICVDTYAFGRETTPHAYVRMHIFGYGSGIFCLSWALKKAICTLLSGQKT